MTRGQRLCPLCSPPTAEPTPLQDSEFFKELADTHRGGLGCEVNSNAESIGDLGPVSALDIRRGKGP